jgi:ribonuclease HII
MDNIIAATRGRQSFNKNYFEHAAWQENQYICGIDEVGRGPLAGPLVTAAVILPIGKTSALLKDSKLTNEQERIKAFAWINKHCWYATGIVHHRIIDHYNIWHATLIAMKKALINLLAIAPRPSAIVVDAMPLNLKNTQYDTIPLHYFPFGESKSSSIAAASIVAKLCRDDIMRRMDPLFPGYQFASHKGYRTPVHKKAVEWGNKPTIIHRLSFINRLAQWQEDAHEQQTLC